MQRGEWMRMNEGKMKRGKIKQKKRCNEWGEWKWKGRYKPLTCSPPDVDWMVGGIKKVMLSSIN